MIEPTPRRIQTVYLVLTLLNTLAASFIWGVNTLFLLDAGLSNVQAFAANAFFTVGQVIFEVPTGIVADIRGRRLSYLLGAATLSLSTLLYLGAWYIKAPMIAWAISSILLGLGFTFFSGATEAWLVDALKFAKYKGPLESVFAKAQVVGGAAMLVGSVSGGVIAQATDLSAPYILRAVLLGLTFAVAFFYMQDWGFTPRKSASIGKDVKRLFTASVNLGFKKPAIRWMMLAFPITSGLGFYCFYAAQPYLLELYGDKTAYTVAGLAAAIVAGAQIVGGLLVPYIRKLFRLRTSVLLTGIALNVILLILIGTTKSFPVAIGLMSLWGLVFAASSPVRQAYLNGLIPSKQRATVLSFDNLLGSSGGVVIQPTLGKVADVWSYGTSFVVGGVIQTIALPFIYLARLKKPRSDKIQ